MKKVPVVIKNAIDSWPAMTNWKNTEYLA